MLQDAVSSNALERATVIRCSGSLRKSCITKRRKILETFVVVIGFAATLLRVLSPVPFAKASLAIENESKSFAGSDNTQL